MMGLMLSAGMLYVMLGVGLFVGLLTFLHVIRLKSLGKAYQAIPILFILSPYLLDLFLFFQVRWRPTDMNFCMVATWSFCALLLLSAENEWFIKVTDREEDEKCSSVSQQR